MSEEANTPEGRKRYRVGFFVQVDVYAAYESEAALVANQAAGWPYAWNSWYGPVHVQGQLNGRLVGADIVVAMPLTTKEIAPTTTPPPSSGSPR